MQKQSLYERCQLIVQQKLISIETAMRETQAAANEETKSSAGDKYETGRAMMHLEKEKLATQRAEALRQRKALDQIDFSRSSSQVAYGSLVQTSQGWFLIAVGLGKVTVADQYCFVISPVAPIGQAMIGKSVGETFTFNGNSVEVISIQ